MFNIIFAFVISGLFPCPLFFLIFYLFCLSFPSSIVLFYFSILIVFFLIHSSFFSVCLPFLFDFLASQVLNELVILVSDFKVEVKQVETLKRCSIAVKLRVGEGLKRN